jgi:predicted NBD/HSP70 family sugar kinase
MRAVRLVAEPLGRAIANLVNMLNPERVILGGSLSGLLELARPEVEASLEHYALEAPSRTLQLVQPGLGDDSALLGAAEVGFAELLADPLAAAALPA